MGGPNPMGKFPTKLITIEAISDKPDKRQAALKADGVWYTIWKDFEGSSTDEYDQFRDGNPNGPFKKGDQAIISYKLGEYQGKPQYTIKSIFPGDSARPTQSTETAIKPQAEAYKASQGHSDEAFWDKKALKQCIWNYWLAGTKSKLLTEKDMDLVADVFNQIERYADQRFSVNVSEPETEISDDEYQGPEEINVEDIPFS